MTHSELTVSLWADTNRSEWRTDRLPFLADVMDSASDESVSEVTLLTACGVGETEALNNMIGWAVDRADGLIGYLCPTMDILKASLQRRVLPMLEGSIPHALEHLDARTHAKTISEEAKLDLSGALTLTGMAAENLPTLTARPIKYLFCNAMDGGVDGALLSLAQRRTFRVPHSKFVVVGLSSEGTDSPTTARWEESDQRALFCACPHCDERHSLSFGNLSWTQGAPETAVYHCPSCRAPWSESERTQAVVGGEWVALRPEVEHHAGFALSALHSPLLTLAEIAQKHEDPNVPRETLGALWGEAPAIVAAVA